MSSLIASVLLLKETRKPAVFAKARLQLHFYCDFYCDFLLLMDVNE